MINTLDLILGRYIDDCIELLLMS